MASKHTTIEQELEQLKPGESLVILRKDATGGYWLGVGDSIASNVWVLTQAEINALAPLVEKYRTPDGEGGS